MRRFVTFALLLVVLSALACDTLAPGQTDVPPTVGSETEEAPAQQTPSTAPATEEAPSQEAQPTAVPTEATEEASPMPVCTPPNCAADEVYYCPGECPGGCGTQCATPTVSSSAGAPTILSFEADRLEIMQGEGVRLSWEATGGTEAGICWVTREAIMECALDPVDPAGGTVTVRPSAPGRPGVTTLVLRVENSAGAAVEELELTIRCTERPLPEIADQQLYGNCPYDTVVSQAAYQPFERGHMVWLEGNRNIYVLYASGRFEIYNDLFEEGDPEIDPSITPPAGLYQPKRGFGLIWRTEPGVRDRLGWATAPEQPFQGWSQSYSATGMHNAGTFIRLLDGSICVLHHFPSQWEFYTP